jgi:hypothetical protein
MDMTAAGWAASWGLNAALVVLHGEWVTRLVAATFRACQPAVALIAHNHDWGCSKGVALGKVLLGMQGFL